MKSPVPDLIHGLRCLTAILAKAEAHCESQEIDPDALLKARLFPDMFDLTRNVITTCDAAKFTAARLSQTEPPKDEGTRQSRWMSSGYKLMISLGRHPVSISMSLINWRSGSSPFNVPGTGHPRGEETL